MIDLNSRDQILQEYFNDRSDSGFYIWSRYDRIIYALVYLIRTHNLTYQEFLFGIQSQSIQWKSRDIAEMLSRCSKWSSSVLIIDLKDQVEKYEFIVNDATPELEIIYSYFLNYSQKVEV